MAIAKQSIYGASDPKTKTTSANQNVYSPFTNNTIKNNSQANDVRLVNESSATGKGNYTYNTLNNSKAQTPVYSTISTAAPAYSYSTPQATNSSAYQALIDAFNKNNSGARDAAINAIMASLDAAKGAYGQQMDAVIGDYDKQVDQNEMRKELARRSVRENQANRGQLDSGLGRQEVLSLNSNYDRTTADIKRAKQQAIDEINNLIKQAEYEAETNKASINNQYANAYNSFITNLLANGYSI